MPVKVLVADDNVPMLCAIQNLLLAEPRIDVVAIASTFADTIQGIADFKPEVLVIDLRLPERRNVAMEMVRMQLAAVPYVVATSFSNDEEAQTLAESYGVRMLLGKMNLFQEMVPAILGCVEGQGARARSLKHRAKTA
jgi:chemotaxis response regulator CheB